MNRAELIKAIAEEIAEEMLEHIEKLEPLTNGEVMKAIFPDIEVTINEFLGSVVIDGAFGKFVTTLDWWLDSYKAESEGTE